MSTHTHTHTHTTEVNYWQSMWAFNDLSRAAESVCWGKGLLVCCSTSYLLSSLTKAFLRLLYCRCCQTCCPSFIQVTQFLLAWCRALLGQPVLVYTDRHTRPRSSTMPHANLVPNQWLLSSEFSPRPIMSPDPSQWHVYSRERKRDKEGCKE